MRRLPSPVALAITLLGLVTAPALAAERHWTFIGGCGSADWFGKTNGPNAEGKTTCWAASAGGASGQSVPGPGDDVFMRHANPNADLVNTFSTFNGTTRVGQAKNLSIAGTAGRFASLAVSSDELQIGERLTLGQTGRGKLIQTDGSIAAGIVILGEPGGVGRYELNQGSLSVTGSSSLYPVLLVGHGGHGEFVQRGGSLDAPALIVAEPGKTGRDAASSFFEMSGGVASIDVIGVGNASDFSVTGGGRMRISGSAALSATQVEVMDSGLLEIHGGILGTVGMYLEGDTLAFSDGAIQFRDVAFLKDFEGKDRTLAFGGGLGAGTPTVRLTRNATLSLPALHVGDFGKGRLEVEAGAVLSTSGPASLGSGKPVAFGLGPGDGAATVTGAGASWIVEGHLNVGVKGRSSVTVADEGLLRTGSAFLGSTENPDELPGRNQVRVEGAGSHWHNQGLLVIGGGNSAAGQASEVVLRDGGALRSDGGLIVREGSALAFQGTGGIVVVASTLLEGDIQVDAGADATWTGSIEMAHGSWLIVDGALTLNGDLAMNGYSILENDGQVTFAGRVSTYDDQVLFGGGLRVFSGGLAVGGDRLGHNLAMGSTRFTASNVFTAQLARSSHDHYGGTGALELGGTLKLVSAGAYQGHAGASFDLFGGTLSGHFDHVDTSGFALGAGLAWDFSQLSSAGIVGISAVPEPGTWALWMAGLVGMGFRARRHRRAV